MDFIKRHKFKLIALSVFLVILIIAGIGLFTLFNPEANKNVYGNRLEGIEKVKISSQNVEEIKDSLKSTGKVNSVEYRLEGRIIEFIIDVKEKTDRITATSLGDKVLDKLGDKIKSYYDIQIYITEKKNKESKDYPIIGYKHKTTLTFIWTNN